MLYLSFWSTSVVCCGLLLSVVVCCRLFASIVVFSLSVFDIFPLPCRSAVWVRVTSPTVVFRHWVPFRALGLDGVVFDYFGFNCLVREDISQGSSSVFLGRVRVLVRLSVCCPQVLI